MEAFPKLCLPLFMAMVGFFSRIVLDMGGELRENVYQYDDYKRDPVAIFAVKWV